MNASSPRLARNNFHLIRLLCALVVCVYHAAELSQYPQIAWVPNYLSPNVALNSFFIISGFLISLSYQRSEHIALFFQKRFFRIYPAYFFVVVGTAGIFWGISTKSLSEYFSSAWWKYLWTNLLLLNFLQPTLPGVFTENRFPDINGSLWTIKVEAFLYTTVPVLSFLSRKLFGKATILATYAAASGVCVLLDYLFKVHHLQIFYHLSREVVGPLSYFLAGALIFHYLPLFERYAKSFLLCGLIGLAVCEVLPLPLISPISLAVVIIFASLFGYLGNFEKFGDFSYGVYILHFPVVQLCLQTMWFKNHPWLYVATVVGTALGGAFALWHLIERPFLAASSHYRRGRVERVSAE
jgi:peptidoglycan/LPS O-acetylase OafA/YrhL